MDRNVFVEGLIFTSNLNDNEPQPSLIERSPLYDYYFKKDAPKERLVKLLENDNDKIEGILKNEFNKMKNGNVIKDYENSMHNFSRSSKLSFFGVSKDLDSHFPIKTPDDLVDKIYSYLESFTKITDEEDKLYMQKLFPSESRHVLARTIAQGSLELINDLLKNSNGHVKAIVGPLGIGKSLFARCVMIALSEILPSNIILIFAECPDADKSDMALPSETIFKMLRLKKRIPYPFNPKRSGIIQALELLDVTKHKALVVVDEANRLYKSDNPRYLTVLDELSCISNSLEGLAASVILGSSSSLHRLLHAGGDVHLLSKYKNYEKATKITVSELRMTLIVKDDADFKKVLDAMDMNIQDEKIRNEYFYYTSGVPRFLKQYNSNVLSKTASTFQFSEPDIITDPILINLRKHIQYRLIELNEDILKVDESERKTENWFGKIVPIENHELEKIYKQRHSKNQTVTHIHVEALIDLKQFTGSAKKLYPNSLDELSHYTKKASIFRKVKNVPNNALNSIVQHPVETTAKVASVTGSIVLGGLALA